VLYLRLCCTCIVDIVIMQSFPVDLVWYFGSSASQRCTMAGLV